MDRFITASQYLYIYIYIWFYTESVVVYFNDMLVYMLTDRRFRFNNMNWRTYEAEYIQLSTETILAITSWDVDTLSLVDYGLLWFSWCWQSQALSHATLARRLLLFIYYDW